MKLQNVYRAHISLASSNTGQTSSRLCKSYAALFEQKSVGNAFIQPFQENNDMVKGLLTQSRGWALSYEPQEKKKRSGELKVFIFKL